MRTLQAVLLAVFIPVVGVAAFYTRADAAVGTPSSSVFHFSTEVEREGAPSVRMNMDVPRGEEVVVTTRAGLRLEIGTAKDIGAADQTVVRLFDVAHGTPVLLHSSTSVEAASFARNIKYSVCPDQTVFSTDMHAPGCRQD